MSKINLMGLTLAQLENAMTDLGEKPYRGRQLYKWLYHSRLYDFSRMTDFSKDLRARLDQQFDVRGLQLTKREKSEDGTERFLFCLEDGLPVETVLIPDESRRTVCLSSQSGCALGCRYCATGSLGLLRNLTVGEIIGQLVFLRDLYGQDCFTNVVFMGMGEPLNNYDNLLKSIPIITDSAGLMIGAKKITVSTCGITPMIRKLAGAGLKTKLALSLNAATQAKRLQIMPVAETYELDGLMDAVRYYTSETGFRVTIEYTLFEGLNDTMEDVRALARLLRGVPCKINVLAYNPVPELAFRRPSDKKLDWFVSELYPRLPAVTVRRSRGLDIGAACGQLAGRGAAGRKT
ncbi:MAG: 23S rRNA (adenine(2503)-C(2))-methyltransferase RlmN [Candidatus Zixiibacteriota bacterium]|nr:MAG: 23S rRNA (adenine(2503)-C(2))-methyltransferase RlmN [candidate division Zixibacteria bacterium]